VEDALTPITSPLLNSAGFRHAFFTREGGVSSGEYASLNFSTSVGDRVDLVAENTQRAATWLGLRRRADLCCAHQVHGADIVEISDELVSRDIQSVPADALIGTEPQYACGVRTADCVPLLVADPSRGYVAAIHAGWRGIVAGVVPRTIARLVELGSRAQQLLVAIGPHIRVSAFEVSDEVADALTRVAALRSIVSRPSGGRPHVDLAACVAEQLRQMGVLPLNVDDVGGCTASEASRFFSYRRQGPASGRHLHAIVPRQAD